MDFKTIFLLKEIKFCNGENCVEKLHNELINVASKVKFVVEISQTSLEKPRTIGLEITIWRSQL